MKKSVGIYMPCHNVSKYVGEAIDSLIAQDFQNWHLVVIDDASDDDTFDTAKKASDSRCIVIRKNERCGLIGKLKNEAISILQDPDFICHVGGDDIIPGDCLSSYLEFMQKNPELVAACGTFDCFDDSGKTWIMPHVMSDRGFDRSKLLKYMCFFPLRFYRFSSFEGYSNTLSSAVDYDLALRLDEKFPGRMGRLEGKITYHYRQHPGQVSRAARPEQDLNAKIALQSSLDRRGTGQKVTNDRPPFQLGECDGHFLWGKK